MVQATRNPYAKIEISGNFEGKINVKKIEYVPVLFPYEKREQKYDSEFVSYDAGLYPDILQPLDTGVQIIKEQWRSLWVDCIIPKKAEGGDRHITISFISEDGEVYAKEEIVLHIVAAELPKQKLIHTEWFYADCLADYYKVEPFSEEHWDILEKYLMKAAERGINMILTPLFTPALDTLIGGERTTSQLVKIEKIGGHYSFDYKNFKRWVKLCKKAGFDYFEMAHLFSQWGAKYPPKIVVSVDGEEQVIFGWNTPVAEGEYEKFLDEFLPTLVKEIKNSGIENCTYFHISDEPTKFNSDTYQYALDIVKRYIGNMPIIDALSHVELYDEGIVKKPVPSSEYVHEFLEHGMEKGWVYYCCGQGYKVSNRFIAMPLCRTRILGIQLYKYKMEGFLHWGYNFYNSQYSIRHIDPYKVTDADDAFPAGDSFIVYPGENGEPVESMRLPIMEDAMLDIRALEFLEGLTDRATVMKIIEKNGQYNIRFDDYPTDTEYLLNLWEKVAEEIERRL